MNKILPLISAAVVIPTIGFSQTIVNDDWSDADRTVTGALQADWWSSSSTSGNSVEVYTNQLGLVTGTSGRGLHGTFAPQTLGIGDSLVATLTFTTPATVGSSRSSSLRFALMDLNDPGLAADLSSSSSSVNPLYVGQPGYMSDFDVNMGDGSEDTSIRKHDVLATGGRFLGTTGEWNSIGSSGDDGYSFTANTEYVGVISVTRTGADSMDIYSSLSEGTTMLTSHTESDLSDIANNFGMLGVWVNSNVFGSTNSAGELEDNGITFSNITVELVPIPEPSTFAFLAGLFLLMGVGFSRRGR